LEQLEQSYVDVIDERNQFSKQELLGKQKPTTAGNRGIEKRE
jgi:hypothetical protein